VADAPHLFEPTARGQTAAGVLDSVIWRAAAAVPEVVLLLRQMPTVVGPERQLEETAARVDWRRACLQYEEEVLRTYAKRCCSVRYVILRDFVVYRGQRS